MNDKKSKMMAKIAERRAKGLPVGPPRKYDYDRIRELRADGWSISEIADEMKCSTWPVQCAIKWKDYK